MTTIQLLLVALASSCMWCCYATSAKVDLDSPFDTTTSLETFFDSNAKGPGLYKFRNYFAVYEHHLQRFRGTDVHVLEIGIYSGGSMKMWRSYFGPTANITGVDLAPSTKVYERNPKYGSPNQILIGSQGNMSFLTEVMRLLPRIDVVLDDGSHFFPHQVTTLDALYEHLAPGGVFLCEDVHATKEFAKHVFEHYVDSADGVIGAYGKHRSRQSFSTIQRTTAEVSFYASQVVLEKRGTKRPFTFNSERRGTEWNPHIDMADSVGRRQSTRSDG